jgi:hypothetical protein
LNSSIRPGSAEPVPDELEILECAGQMREVLRVVGVPFRILTEEEEKFLSKNYRAIDRQVEEAFKKK